VTRLVFGEITRDEAERLPIDIHHPTPEERLVDAKPKMNPCVRVFGPGPEGATCKECMFLECYTTNKNWYKCAMRPYSRGPGTDHRKNWPACDRYFKRAKGKDIPTHAIPK
jgi:hypothetical protein